MKKKIEIFGRKVPVIAIMIVLLVIGTASATVFNHYATLTGNVVIDSPITVIDDDGDRIPIGDFGDLTFTSSAEFKVENSGNGDVTVYLVTTIKDIIGEEVQESSTTDPVTVIYTVTSPSGTIENGALTIPGGYTSTVSVEVSSPPNVEGNYQVQVEIASSAPVA